MQEKQEETQQNCARGSCSKGFKTMCGGQALIEGIMMRGPKKESVVVRRPDGGLEIQERELRFIRDRYPVLGWPLIRGVVNFGGSMYSGVKALMYSASFFPEDEEEPEPVRGDTEDGTASMALVIAQTERDTYKRMYESLLARMTMEREETA